MLGLQGPSTDTGCFQNVRCGGVYYIGHDTYHVNCSLCDQNILYKLFPQHFLWHLSQEEECKLFNKNGRLVKRGQVLDASAQAEEDPIGNHECGGETVDLAEIAKLDIEINGTVTSVESEECRETLLNRKDKASTTIHEHDEKSKQKGSLQRPLLRDNRKRRNIGSSTSTNVTRSRESNVVKESPTEQRHNESIKIPSLDSLSENVVDRAFSTQHQTTERKNTKLDPSITRVNFRPVDSSSTNEVLKSKITTQTPAEKSFDKPSDATTQDPFAENTVNPKSTPLLRTSTRVGLFGTTSTNDAQATESKITKLASSAQEGPLLENDDGHASSTSDPFEDSDDRCESPDWLPDADERKKKDNDDEEKDYMKRSFTCDECDRSYLSKRAMCNHKRLKHLINKNKGTSDKKNLIDKLGHCKSSDWLSEAVDRHDKIYVNSNSKIEPDQTDDDDGGGEDQWKYFECDQCERAFGSQQGLKRHKRAKHSSKQKIEFKCADCDKTFPSERQLDDHHKEHTGITCDICGRPFAKVAFLTKHRIRHSGIKTFKCDECEARFYTQKELKAHKIRHTGRMPIICEVCGRPCRDHGVYTAHMRRHTGERPAKCDVCGKSFFSIHDLNVHAVAHTTARPFVCNICGSSFQRKKALRVHKLLHSDTRKHDCKICGKKFAQSSGLNTHLRTHDAAASRGVIPNAENEVGTMSDNRGHGEFSVPSF